MYSEALFLFGILIVLISNTPIGSEKYFTFLQFINYFEVIVNDYIDVTRSSGTQKKKNGAKNRRWIILLIGFSLLSYSISSLLSIATGISMVLALSIILAIYMNTGSSSKEITLLKKFIFYNLVLFITITANLEVEPSATKTLLLIITVFFSLDRIINLSKDVLNLITQKSVLYYYEHEDIPKLKLYSKLINTDDIIRINLDEVELVKQIIIRNRLNYKEECLKIIEIYKAANFHQYMLLVSTYEYYLNFKESDLDDLEMLKERIYNIINMENQKIFIPDLYIEYGGILYLLEDYKECIVYLSDESTILSLNETQIKMLITAYEKMGDLKKSERMKKIMLTK